MLLIRNLVLGILAFLALACVGVQLVRYARGRSAGAYAVGAVLILFGVGNVRDPAQQMLSRAQPQVRNNDDPGDPPAE